MELQEIEVDINPDGSVQLHVRGMSGPGCVTTTEALEKALGQVQSREMTPEAFDDPMRQSTQDYQGTSG